MTSPRSVFRSLLFALLLAGIAVPATLEAQESARLAPRGTSITAELGPSPVFVWSSQSNRGPAFLPRPRRDDGGSAGVGRVVAGTLAGALFGGIAGGLLGGRREECAACDIHGATLGALAGGGIGLTVTMVLR